MSEYNMNDHMKEKYLLNKGGGHGMTKARTGNSSGRLKTRNKDAKASAYAAKNIRPKTMFVNGLTGKSVMRYAE